MDSRRKRNLYTHAIDLTNLQINNSGRSVFRKKLEEIFYRGYRVEDISDGRNIVITKPGGKFSFGTLKREDFMVWIHNPIENSLWLISHKDILKDLKDKSAVDPKATLAIIAALERVYNGEEPDDVYKGSVLQNQKGEWEKSGNGIVDLRDALSDDLKDRVE